MQRLVRSIVPRIIGESFNESEAANNITVPESNADAVKGAAKDEAKGAAMVLLKVKPINRIMQTQTLRRLLELCVAAAAVE